MTTDHIAVSQADLARATQEGVLQTGQAERLWAFLAAVSRASVVAPAANIAAPRFDFTHVLYYFGGLIAIGAVSLFLKLSWDAAGPWGVFVLALGLFLGCWRVAISLLGKKLHVAAGILATLAVVLVPLMTWCAQHAMGLWPEGFGNTYTDYHAYIDWRWITLELVTLAAASAMLYRFRLPFMVMPVAVTLWYMSMDLADMLTRSNTGSGWSESWQFKRDVSLVFGLITCLLAIWVDMRSRMAMKAAPGSLQAQDFAFWLYLFGAIMAWTGLTMQNSGSELGKFIYCCINVAMVFGGVILQRRVFTVLGAIGVCAYIGNLGWRVFPGSIAFAAVLVFIGLALVAAGIWWQRNEGKIAQSMARFTPHWLQS